MLIEVVLLNPKLGRDSQVPIYCLTLEKLYP